MIEYESTPEVHRVIAELGRTEDLRFSPGGNSLAIAAFNSSKIVLLKIDIAPSPAGTKISITDYVRFSSADIEHPHGVAFIDEETLVVANRSQFVSVFRIPAFGGIEKEFAIKPLGIIRKKRFRKLDSPGSVDVYAISKDKYRLLICDNYAHAVTVTHLTARNRLSAGKNRVLLDKGLDVPDGISVSASRRWIAVSNHTPGTVFIYANTRELDNKTDPVAILAGMDCPHGLRFARQDQMIVVADAASPHLFVYLNQGDIWSGEYQPYRIIRVLDDQTFHLGRYNEEEGGTKGIDILNGTLATTCEHQPLTFYDFDSFLQQSSLS